MPSARIPPPSDEDLRGLTVAVLPLTAENSTTFGTTPEMISSTAALQNVVKDQRLILRRGVKKHSTIFTQNARVELSFAPELQNIWVENSHLPAGWQLEGEHVLTGIPVNDRTVHLRRGQCVDVEAYGDRQFVLRPYGFHDAFRGDVHDRLHPLSGSVPSASGWPRAALPPTSWVAPTTCKPRGSSPFATAPTRCLTSSNGCCPNSPTRH